MRKSVSVNVWIERQQIHGPSRRELARADWEPATGMLTGFTEAATGKPITMEDGDTMNLTIHYYGGEESSLYLDTPPLVRLTRWQ